VGWLREEFDALGIPWEQRGARTDDYIAAMRALWDTDHAAHEGPFSKFANISSNPKPVNGRVPIHIGGHSEAAAARAGRIGDGFFPGTGELGDLVSVMNEHAERAGRDPASIEVTSGDLGIFGPDPVSAVDALAARGVHRIAVPAFLFLDGTADKLAEFGETVITPTAAMAPAGSPREATDLGKG
jgi:alkanesulfonate monooxygenase SsuD/methylene tetrahydromethanopterin reductase-like flavin-dependent oxidoreductase (luciferase family)